VSKYCDHLPLYRQCEIYARQGLELDRSTLCDWVGQAAWLLDPIVAAIRAQVFAADKIHGDDTTVPVLEPGLGRTRTGRLWAYVRDDRPFCGEAPPAAAYFYSPDRTAVRPAAHLANFTGFLQADAYAGFEKLYRPARTKPGPIIEVACWAHTRRGFFDEWEHRKSATAKEALDRIAAIYAIEARAAMVPISERAKLRCQTAPLVEAFLPGQRQPSPSYRPNPRWRAHSTTPSIAARRCHGSSPTVGWRWTTILPKMRCAALLWAGRIISSPGQMPAVTGLPRSTPSSRRQSSMASIQKSTCVIF